jgi:D-aspartate ligase
MKPAVSEEYWHHPFEGMRKVWFTNSREEAENVREKMRSAGYRGTILLQERIPAHDTDNGVLTVYCDRTAKVRAIAYGRVLLEEHTPRGLGNHAAILTERPPAVAERLTSFLEEIGYRGFANFDLLSDPGGGEPYVLEMNLRQGRSNHYMTAAGINPAGLVIADCAMREELPVLSAIPDVLWHSVPLSVAYSRVKDGSLLRRLRSLEAAGRAVSPFHARGDLSHNPLRRLFVWEHERRIRRRSAIPTAE